MIGYGYHSIGKGEVTRATVFVQVCCMSGLYSSHSQHVSSLDGLRHQLTFKLIQSTWHVEPVVLGLRSSMHLGTYRDASADHQQGVNQLLSCQLAVPNKKISRLVKCTDILLLRVYCWVGLLDTDFYQMIPDLP